MEVIRERERERERESVCVFFFFFFFADTKRGEGGDLSQKSDFSPHKREKKETCEARARV